MTPQSIAAIRAITLDYRDHRPEALGRIDLSSYLNAILQLLDRLESAERVIIAANILAADMEERGDGEYDVGLMKAFRRSLAAHSGREKENG